MKNDFFGIFYSKSPMILRVIFQKHGFFNSLLITANGIALDPDVVVTDANFVVGQDVPFALSGMPSGVTATDHLWSLGGVFVNDHTNAGPDASENYFMNSSLMTHSTLDHCWWVSGGLPTTYFALVSYTLTFANGQPPINLMSMGWFHMFRPQANMWAYYTDPYGHIRADNNYLSTGTWWLHFGGNVVGSYPAITYPGIVWRGQVTTPKNNGAGEIAFTQLSQKDRRQTKDDETNEKSAANGRGYLLDGHLGVQYGGASPIGENQTVNHDRSDSPANELTADYKKSSAADAFKLYLIYKPSGDNSIWVTLRTLTWNWNGSATKDTSTGIWSLDSGADATATTSVDSTDFPVWTNTIDNFNSWIPE